jgi:hypothetical protein
MEPGAIVPTSELTPCVPVEIAMSSCVQPVNREMPPLWNSISELPSGSSPVSVLLPNVRTTALPPPDPAIPSESPLFSADQYSVSSAPVMPNSRWL